MTEQIWDVLVIGGGPSGMMAAGRAASLGARVLLLEKNDSLGKKLLITGGGRCNVTNAEFDTRLLLKNFKEDGKYLFSAFAEWNVQNTLDFFHERKMDTKVEKEKRVFPITDSAQSVWDVLVTQLRRYDVTILSNSEVVSIMSKNKEVTGVRLKNKKEIFAKHIILATGGTSRPETGSTGDGYKWLRDLGHTVVDPTPSLVPIALKDKLIHKLAGVTLTSIKLTTLQNNVKQGVVKGKLLFTHVGISGPTVLNMSKDVGELLQYGEVVISLDLIPSLDYGKLNEKLQELFKINHTKKFKNAIDSLIPSAMSDLVISLSGIDPHLRCNSITRDERLKLVKVLKDIPLHVDKLLGKDKAIITSGGVVLDEVDFRTMQSRLYPNLYIIGDMLNIDRPSGGYSLQLCWTTGFVAGSDSAKKK